MQWTRKIDKPPPLFNNWPPFQFKAKILKFFNVILFWPLHHFKKFEKKPSPSLYNSTPHPPYPLPLSTIKHSRVPFSSCQYLLVIWHVVLVRIILTNNHIKFLAQTSIGLARLMGMLLTITLIDWNMSKLRNISFSVKGLYK